jgi:hypothetical protein
MNDTDLLEKAGHAAYAYRVVWGKFPAMIGVDARRLATLPGQIIFPDPPPHEYMPRMDELPKSFTLDLHRCRLLPVAGPEVDIDSVYVPADFPADFDETSWSSAEAIERRAEAAALRRRLG